VRFGLYGEEAAFAWRRASRTRVDGANPAPEQVCMAARAGARTLGSSMAAKRVVDGVAVRSLRSLEMLDVGPG
jgi:hypothetical protein